MESLVEDSLTLAYHELRAPLGLMATAARSAALDCEDEALKRRVEIIVRAAERMLRTTQRVLALASASRPGEVTRFSPAALLEEIAVHCEALGLAVVYFPGSNLAEQQIETDRDAVEAIILSLVHNAVDHGEAGGRIELSAVPEGEGVVVTVANHIAEGTRHRGLGAGTYLCEQLAARIGGRLSLEVDGCRFRATLRVPA